MSTPAQREAVARRLRELFAEGYGANQMWQWCADELIAAYEAAAPCGMCEGHGFVGRLMPDPNGYDCQTCPECDGSGNNSISSVPAPPKDPAP